MLSHVNLVIPAGKLTAVVGDSGSGKSTIMNLIGKYYEPDQGEILIGNVNIRDYPSEAVLSRIALVDQDVFLFDDTAPESARMEASYPVVRDSVCLLQEPFCATVRSFYWMKPRLLWILRMN